MNRVLVVEDEQHLADGLRFNLEAEGYGVEIVESGEQALERLLAPSQLAQSQPAPSQSPPSQTPASQTAGSQTFDVVILDVMLPGQDGFSVISEMRRAGQFIPTLMLTARGHPHDVLRGFEAGADDYLTKPFELSILIARIRGLLRRREWLQTSAGRAIPASKVKDVFTFGDNADKTINFDLLELSVGNQVFRLTLMEANLLRYLIEHEGRPISRKKMLDEVWSLQEDTDTRPIDNFIVRLRRYIEDDPTKPRHLLTVRGVGYRFVAAPGA